MHWTIQGCGFFGFLPLCLAQVVEHALALEDAGCFAVVLECIPDVVSAAITKALSIPTIGIGAGVHCSGQVGALEWSGSCIASPQARQCLGR